MRLSQRMAGTDCDRGCRRSWARSCPCAWRTAKLTASDGVGSDNLGDSVAIEGNVLVAGAPGDDGNKGAVYVFERSGGTWTQTGKLTASDGQGTNGGNDIGDFLGGSVAIQGSTIVAGAPGWDADDSNGLYRGQGAVYTFAATGAAARTETARLTSSDPVNASHGDALGAAVDIDGSYIAAGAPGGDWEELETEVRRGRAVAKRPGLERFATGFGWGPL